MIVDGSLLVRDGILLEVGPTRRVENLALARQAIEIDAAGRVVMPGFVDSHTHLLFPPAGLTDGDIENQVRAVHATTAMQLTMRARVYLQAMARHGTTTLEVKTGAGADGSAEMKILRVLAELKKEPIDIVPSFLFRAPPSAFSEEAQFAAMWHRVCAEFLPNISRRGWANFADLAWDRFCMHEQAFIGYMQVAHSRGLGCKLHAEGQEISAAVAAAAECRVTSIDHLEHATAANAKALGQCEAVATLLPSASFHRGDEYAPARQLIDAGAAVALATNFNPNQTPSLSMQTVLALACQQMGMTPAEAMSATTINGAHALGCAHRLGSLEHGKQADLLFLNTSDYRDLAHSLGTNLVHMAMKRGEVIYEEGEVAPRPAEDLPRTW